MVSCFVWRCGMIVRSKSLAFVAVLGLVSVVPAAAQDRRSLGGWPRSPRHFGIGSTTSTCSPARRSSTRRQRGSTRRSRSSRTRRSIRSRSSEARRESRAGRRSARTSSWTTPRSAPMRWSARSVTFAPERCWRPGPRRARSWRSRTHASESAARCRTSPTSEMPRSVPTRTSRPGT